MAYPKQFPNHWFAYQCRITDVSTADSEYIPAARNGKIKYIETCLKNAITVADSNVTVEISGTAVTGSAIVVAQSGSAAGDIDTATPTAANSFVAGQFIRVVTDGASTTAAPLQVTLWCEPT